MLTPKSLFTWMIASRLSPWSIAYFAAATPCRASDVMVRKKIPRVWPSAASFVSVGEDEAGEIWTTPAGPVTEVTIGMGHRRDDAAEDRRHAAQVDELARLVDRDRALGLGVAQVDGEVASGRAARRVDVAEGELCGLRRRLPEAPGGAGERDDHAHGMGAGGLLGLRGDGQGGRGERGGQEDGMAHGISPRVLGEDWRCNQ